MLLVCSNLILFMKNTQLFPFFATLPNSLIIPECSSKLPSWACQKSTHLHVCCQPASLHSCVTLHVAAGLLWAFWAAPLQLPLHLCHKSYAVSLFILHLFLLELSSLYWIFPQSSIDFNETVSRTGYRQQFLWVASSTVQLEFRIILLHVFLQVHSG